jgi:pimeloyl-ACP methyl ester carboxylesterase
MTCGATSLPPSRTATASSRSTSRWERIRGRCRPGPDRSATSLARLTRALLQLQLRPSVGRRKVVSSVTASGLDDERAKSFFGPAQRDRRVDDDLVAASAGTRPQLLIDAAEALAWFDRPVLLIWGESCDFFPITGVKRLASEFPSATLVSAPGAKTWSRSRIRGR